MALFLDILTTGALVSFVAMGYSLIYGVLRFINFAHGELIALTAYITLSFLVYFKATSFIYGFIISAVTGAIIAMLLERLLYRPFRNTNPLTLLLASFAASIIIQSLLNLSYGSQSKIYHLSDPVISIFNEQIYSRHIFLICLTIVIFLILDFSVRKTLWGITVRGYSCDAFQVSVLGVKIDNAISITFAMAGSLAGISGFFLGLGSGISPGMGFHFGLWAFAATVVGGLGSIRGTFIGGILLGIILSLSTRYFSVIYTDAIAFFVMTLVLLIKPKGLFAFLDRQV